MKLYLLNMNGAESGPYTEKLLRSMWLAGAVTVNAEWRLTNNTGWISGKSLPSFLEGAEIPEGRVIDGLREIRSRNTVRDLTAYPFARSLVKVIVGVAFVTIALSWFLVLAAYPYGNFVGAIVVAVPLTLGALIYWAFALVALALLDIADLALKNR